MSSVPAKPKIRSRGNKPTNHIVATSSPTVPRAYRLRHKPAPSTPVSKPRQVVSASSTATSKQHATKVITLTPSSIAPVGTIPRSSSSTTTTTTLVPTQIKLESGNGSSHHHHNHHNHSRHSTPQHRHHQHRPSHEYQKDDEDDEDEDDDRGSRRHRYRNDDPFDGDKVGAKRHSSAAATHTPPNKRARFDVATPPRASSTVSEEDEDDDDISLLLSIASSIDDSIPDQHRSMVKVDPEAQRSIEIFYTQVLGSPPPSTRMNLEPSVTVDLASLYSLVKQHGGYLQV